MKQSLISDRIKQLMKAKGWTVTELANKAGIPKGSISKWANGKSNITIQSIEKIENVFGESIINVNK